MWDKTLEDVGESLTAESEQCNNLPGIFHLQLKCHAVGIVPFAFILGFCGLERLFMLKL